MNDSLPPELADLIAGEQSAAVAGAAEQAAIRAMIGASISGGSAVISAKLLALILGIAAVGGIGVMVAGRGDRTAVARAPHVGLPQPAPSPAPSPAPPEPSVALPAAAITAPPVSTPATAPPPSATRARTASVARPPAESALLAQAARALASGDAASALELVADHTRRYPRSRLVEERDALHVRALFAAGRSDEARAARSRFVAEHPASIYQSAIDRALTQEEAP